MARLWPVLPHAEEHALKLRDYQLDAIARLRAEYAQGRKAPCLVMPTGAGKTPTAAEIIRLALARGQRPMFLAGRLELLDQAEAKLRAAGIDDVRVIQAERDTAHNGVVVASVPTLASPRWATQLPPADLLVFDEVQHLKARTWLGVANHYNNAFKLGLTATPQRGDGSPLGDVLDAIVIGATVGQLTERGYLVPCRVFAPPTILDSRSLALDPVDAYLKHCRGQRTIVFCATVEHARRTAEAFTTCGIRAAYVTGEMAERSDVIARYAAGDLDVLVNVNLLVEGWDDPTTSAAIFARRFTHAGSYLQACGRILRPAASKTSATVVDLCGSALVHGTPDSDRQYSLDGKPIRTTDREPLKQCPGCGGVFTARDVCPYCALQQPTAARSLPTATGAGVSEVAPKQKPTSWPMRAKKRSLCSGCGHQIDVGAWIIYSSSKRTAQHTTCAAKAERRAA
jgi:DNA repair protein RadD